MFQSFKPSSGNPQCITSLQPKVPKSLLEHKPSVRRMHVYTIAAHQRIAKAALPESPVFSACEVLEILDVFSPFITP